MTNWFSSDNLIFFDLSDFKNKKFRLQIALSFGYDSISYLKQVKLVNHKTNLNNHHYTILDRIL